MSVVNAAATAAFDVIGGFLGLLPGAAGLALVSVLTAIAILLAVRLTGDARRIRSAKAGMAAGLFEIRLFNDDLRAIARAQLSVVTHILKYWRATLVPILWLALPLTLTVAQLDAFYGYAPLTGGRPILLTALLRDEADPATIRLQTPHGIEVQTPAVWFPSTRQVMWRLKSSSVGTFSLHVHVGARDFVKTLNVSDHVSRTSPQRVSPGFARELRFPSERPLPSDGPVRALTIVCERGDVDVFGWRVSWILAYTVLSLVFALLLRKPFRVTF